ncbi:MAG TPA: glycosyl hydrolase [Chloroflexi bacterium]|nr:glycosyl hydrolase [Chloroflexota bacterium]HHW84895.1 glycosyl hydrolase [Chloroflexota bacterium]
MTLEEKAALVTGATPWTTTPVARLGVPELFVSDGPHGVRRVEDVNTLGAQSIPATCFPTAALLAATWNADLVYRMGQALASEANAIGVGVLLGPGVNMKRTPLCGRNFEYFSEDPYLAGELAASLIEGIQSGGVGASLKHFAANNQEHQRFSIDAVVDERTLREIYLPAFERAVKRAKPWTVMCAYNKLNGEYCSEHYTLLTEILKQEWGFEGFVVSDWGAVHDRVKALRAGLDLEMPGPKPRRTQAVIDAVHTGELDAAVLDEAVRRVLTIAFRAAETPKGAAFDVEANHALARQIAAEGMVLLKNDGILPLQNPQRVAVIGRAAKYPHFQGGGSSHINPTRVDSPFDALQSRAGGATLTYSEGYPAGEEFQQSLIDEAVTAARSANVALIFVALPSYKESEGYDRTDLDLTAQQVALIKAVSAVQPHTVVILHNSSAVAMTAWIDGVGAVLEAWLMGQAGGGAVADILYGVTNPSGKLAETFPLHLEDTPAFINFPGENGQVRYGEGLFIGYRYYDAKRAPVLFPFGHGLSYTTFAYSNARVSAPTFRDVDGVTVSVDVTNTGAMAGKEIVQIYVHDRHCQFARPEKELKGFAKVELQPGETKTVTLALDFRAFAFWHPGHKQWVAEAGEFDILIGASAADIRASVPVTLQSTQTLPSLLNYTSTVREWLEDPHGRTVFEPLFQQMMAQMQQAFGGGDRSNEDDIGMNMMGFIMETPLTSILGFQEALLPAPAEVIVGELLRQVHGR